MIFDHINNLAHYTSVTMNLNKFIAYIKQNNIAQYAPGEYIIDDDIYFTVKCYQPRLQEKAGWETHRKFLDIQYLLEGRELMGIMPSREMKEKGGYDPISDKTAYHPADNATYLKITPGMFVLLLPQDAHRPSIVDGEDTQNKKVVVKVRI